MPLVCASFAGTSLLIPSLTGALLGSVMFVSVPRLGSYAVFVLEVACHPAGGVNTSVRGLVSASPGWAVFWVGTPRPRGGFGVLLSFPGEATP